MLIKIYNVQKRKHSLRNFLFFLFIRLSYFTRVIDGYSSYGLVNLLDQDDNIVTYHIMLEEVSRINDHKPNSLL